LHRWIKIAADMEPLAAFHYVCDCVKKLPIPVIKEGIEDIWDQISISEIPSLLQDFQSLMHVSLCRLSVNKNPNVSRRNLDEFLLIYTLYAIVDKLARRLDITKLKGFISPFLPLDFNFVPQGFVALNLESDNKRYTQLHLYFLGETHLKKVREGKFIFPLDSFLPIEKFFNDQRQGGYDGESQGENQIEYLAQFLPPHRVGFRDYIDMWITALPKESQILYYFSFLSFLHITEPSKRYPISLEFEKASYEEGEGLDVRGLDHLWNSYKFKKGSEVNYEAFTEITFSNRESYIFNKKNKQWRMRSNYRRGKFLDIFSPEIRNLTSNEAACFSVPKELNISLSEKQVRLLLSIYCNECKFLRFWRFIQEFSKPENYLLFDHEAAQEIIEICVFQPIYLIQELQKNESETAIQGFRRVIHGALSFYGASLKNEAILFLLKIGISFETYTCQTESKTQIITFYESIIHSLLVNRELKDYELRNLYLILIFLRTASKEFCKSFAEFQDLTSVLFQVKLESDFYRNRIKPLWLRESFSAFKRDFFYKNIHFIEKNSSELCNRILSTLLMEFPLLSSFNSNWEGSFPEFRGGDYIINFLEGTLSHRYLGVLKRDQRNFLQRSHADHFASDSLFWVSEHEKRSLDGKWHFSISEGKWSEISFLPNGEERRREVYCFDSYRIRNTELDFSLGIQKLGWQKTLREDDNTLIIYNEKDEPYLKVVDNPTGTVYSRVDRQAVPLPITLVNLSLVTLDHFTYPYTLRFSDYKDILCFVDQREISKIVELHFLAHKLSFIRDEHGLESSQFPGMYLIAIPEDLSLFSNSSAQSTLIELLEEINNYKQAMILYGPQENRWIVIFPNYDLTCEKEVFSHIVHGTKGFNSEVCYYFEYNPLTKVFYKTKETNDEGYLFLTYLLKMQGDYEKALSYLKRINPFEIKKKSFSFIFFQKFKSIQDYSMPSIAFNLKMILFLIRSRNVMSEGFFVDNENVVRDFDFYIVWGIQLYKAYNENAFSILPEELRITKSEQRILLLAFRNYYQSKKKNLSESWDTLWAKELPNFDAQLLLLFSPQNNVTLRPQPQKVSLAPPIFPFIREPHDIENNVWISHWEDTYFQQRKERAIPKYAVRVPAGTTLANFPDLFKMATDSKSANHFDYILPALLKEGNAIEYHKKAYLPACVLFWVRHFSDQFLGEEFKLNDEILNSRIRYRKFLENVIEKVITLGKFNPERYEQFKKDYLELHQMHTVEEKRIEGSKSLSSKENYSARDIQLGARDLIKLSSEDLVRQLKELEDKIFRVFNGHYKRSGLASDQVEEEGVFLLKKLSSEILNVSRNQYYKKESLPEIIMRKVILKNNYAFFKDQRKMLIKEEMQSLCGWVCEWYFIQVLLKLKKEKKEHLFDNYDYQNYPEFSYFYLSKNQFPRTKQMRIYERAHRSILNGKNLHFQLKPGDGKSTIFIPLLFLLAKRCGLMGVAMVPTAIYPVEKSSQSFTCSLLNEHLAVLEIRMTMIHQISGFDLEFIFQELLQYKYEGKNLIITKDTYASLYLISQYACIMSILAERKPEEDTTEMKLERGKKIRWSFEILNFFEKHALLICDESHQVMNPKNRSIFGVGESYILPLHESYHLFDLMYFYRNDFSDSSSHQNVKKIYEAYRKDHSVSVVDLQTALALSYLDLFSTEITSGEREAFQNYWTKKEYPEPASLVSWGESTDPKKRILASKIALTRYFLDSLEEFLSMRTDIDHARSPNLERRHEVPAHNKITSSAEYEDLYKTIILTTKGFYDRGIGYEDFFFLMETLVKQHYDEQKKGRRRPTQDLFRQWVAGTSYEKWDLSAIDFNETERITQLFELLKRNSFVIEYFLKKCSFTEIGAPYLQLTCTIADFNFAKTIAFSGTPNSELAYPSIFERGPFGDFSRNQTSELNVKKTLCEPKNSKMIFLKDSPNFFKEMVDTHINIWSKTTVILDPRGFLDCYDNEQIARLWLDSNKNLDAVIYCCDGKSKSNKSQKKNLNDDKREKIDREDKEESEQGQAILLRDGTIHYFKGNNIKASLSEFHLNWDTLNIGTYYDPPHCESWHVDQKDNTLAVLLVCDGLSTAYLIQTLMRLRGFTNTNQNQTVIQVYNESLKNKIFKEESPSSELLIKWSEGIAKNQERKNIILNAFTRIRKVISKQAYFELKKAHALDKSLEMNNVIEVFRARQGGFTDQVFYDAYLLHGRHDLPFKTRFVLEDYARKSYLRFNYSLPYEENIEIKIEVDEIIRSIEAVIDVINSKSDRAITQSVEHMMELKTQTEREQENFKARSINPNPLTGVYGTCGIDTPEYLTKVDMKISAKTFSPFLSKNLYFLRNFMRTAKIEDSGDEDLQFLKPVEFITILVYKDKEQTRMRAEFDCNGIINDHRMRFVNCPPYVKDLTHSAFIVNLLGDVIEIGAGALRPSKELVKQFVESKWYRDLQIDAALLRGEILDMDEVLQRIKSLDSTSNSESGWSIFENLWNNVLNRLIDPGYAHTADFEELKARYNSNQSTSIIKKDEGNDKFTKAKAFKEMMEKVKRPSYDEKINTLSLEASRIPEEKKPFPY
jgi:hypothetical protein